MFSSLVLCCYAEMFRCVFGPLLVHLCALCVPVHLYELYMNMNIIITDRNSYMSFRLVPKSVILNDLFCVGWEVKP